MSFQVDCERSDEKILINLRGDLDISQAPELKKLVLAEYEKGPGDLSFDLSGLDYIDSTGLGLFIAFYKMTKEDGHAVEIYHAKPNVLKLFRITEIDKIIKVGE